MRSALLVSAFLVAGCVASPSSDEEVREELLTASQALLDAVTTGDQELFRRTLDPEGLFVDEDGKVRRGPDLIGEIRPLPPGYVGSLRLVDPHVRLSGDLGIVTFEVAETLDLHGQHLATRFHTTNVFQRGRAGWRLLASHTSVLPGELQPIAVDPATFEEYEGVYRLSSEVSARVWREGDRLFFQRAGRDREELLPIGAGRFVRAGSPRGERFFRRGGSGAVTEMVDRRDNNDLVWRRD